MIGSLRGTLLDHGDDGEVLIEVAGIGYRVVALTSLEPSVSPLMLSAVTL